MFYEFGSIHRQLNKDWFNFYGVHYILDVWIVHYTLGRIISLQHAHVPHLINEFLEADFGIEIFLSIGHLLSVTWPKNYIFFFCNFCMVDPLEVYWWHTFQQHTTHHFRDICFQTQPRDLQGNSEKALFIMYTYRIYIVAA